MIVIVFIDESDYLPTAQWPWDTPLPSEELLASILQEPPEEGEDNAEPLQHSGDSICRIQGVRAVLVQRRSVEAVACLHVQEHN